MKLLKQSIVLALSFISIFIWQNTFLGNYTFVALGVLFICYCIVGFRKKNFDLVSTIHNDLLGLYILHTLLVLIVMMSGNYSSPVFFLLYFLSFGIAFGYEAGVIFVFVIGIILLLSPFTLKDDQTRNILMLGSLIAVSFVAFFFGKTYLKKK